MKPAPKPGYEIRRNEDGTLDEIVGWAFVHLEQMSATAWWMGLDTDDGKLLHVNFRSKATIRANVEDEGPSDLWQRRVHMFEVRVRRLEGALRSLAERIDKERADKRYHSTAISALEVMVREIRAALENPPTPQAPSHICDVAFQPDGSIGCSSCWRPA